jgi:hypothetical protein
MAATPPRALGGGVLERAAPRSSSSEDEPAEADGDEPTAAPEAPRARAGARARATVRVGGRDIEVTTATCRRASRMADTDCHPVHARFSSAANDARARARGALVAEGRSERVATERDRQAHSRAGASGEAVRAASAHGGVRQVLARSQNIDSYARVPSWVLPMQWAPPKHHRLIECALRSVAHNAALPSHDRETTQGASVQTTRINCRTIGQAAATQCVAVAVALALAEDVLRAEGERVLNPLATNAADPIALLDGCVADGQCALVLTSERMTYHAHPCKLSTESIATAAQRIARDELDRARLSQLVPVPKEVLTRLCSAVLAEDYEADPLWASVVLVVFALSDARSRPYVADHVCLTNLDATVATVLEEYGRVEISRRARNRRLRRRARPDGSRDDSGGDEDDDVLEDGLADEELRGERCLAAKRPRAARASTGRCGVADGAELLVWWDHALLCEDRSVLQTLLASSTERSDEAVGCVLAQQQQRERHSAHAPNPVLQRAMRDARRCTGMLKRVIQETDDEAPRWIAFKQPLSSHGAVGLLRNEDAAQNSSLAVAVVPPAPLRASASTGVRVLWLDAFQTFNVRDECRHVPGVAESLRALGSVRWSETAQRQMRRRIQENANPPVCARASQRARSIVLWRARLPVPLSTRACAHEIAARARVARRALSASPRPVLRALGARQPEPVATPASALALGIHCTELLMHLQNAGVPRTRKSDPCRVLLGACSASEMAAEVACVMDKEPLPVAMIVDFAVRCEAHRLDDAEQLGEPTPTYYAPASIAVHVAVDGAVRVPEVLSHLQARDGCTRMQRGVLYAAASQASFVSELSANLRAAALGSSIASSKRNAVADLNTAMLLTAFDVVAGGVPCVHSSFVGTPYTGAYGPLLDTGLTSVGFVGRNHSSDRRGHGTMTLGDEDANDLALAFASAHYVPCGDDEFVRVPCAARGIPHGFVPDVHSVLDDAQAALRELFDGTASQRGARAGHPTTLGLFAVPASAFSQALAPHVDDVEGARRQRVGASALDGALPVPDPTAREAALLREPLFRRPALALACENPFATAYEYGETAFATLAQLALIARTVGGVDALHARVSAWHDAPAAERLPWSAQWAADACVLLFGVLFPATHVVGEHVVPAAYARACAAVARHERACAGGASLARALEDDPARLAEARQLWDRCRRSSATLCPWRSAVAPMLRWLLAHDGSHDLSLEQRARARALFETVVTRGAWLAYSSDGRARPAAPNPACDAASWECVCCTHLEPIFVARGKHLDVRARGGLVGLRPHQLRQVLALMLGAHLVSDVQCARNEGQLSVRNSASPLIRQSNGSSRSLKATTIFANPLADGTHDARCDGADRQRTAWGINARLMLSLFTSINAPRNEHDRLRGGLSSPAAAGASRTEVNELFRRAAAA